MYEGAKTLRSQENILHHKESECKEKREEDPAQSLVGHHRRCGFPHMTLNFLDTLKVSFVPLELLPSKHLCTWVLLSDKV